MGATQSLNPPASSSRSHHARSGSASSASDHRGRRVQQTSRNFDLTAALKFHKEVHGINVRVSSDGKCAKRYTSFCNAIAFTSRPLRVREVVRVKFKEMSGNWSGILRFGFTSHNPASVRENLPRYVCPDLSSKPGYWAKSLDMNKGREGDVLNFYTSPQGQIIFFMDSSPNSKQVFLTGVDPSAYLWAVFDIYGNSVEIELLESQNVPVALLAAQGNVCAPLSNLPVTSTSSNPTNSNADNILQAIVAESHIAVTLSPLKFHAKCGRNVNLQEQHQFAVKQQDKYDWAQVFTERPLNVDEILYIKVLDVDDNYLGGLNIGVTNCDPTSIQQLPQDSNQLVDRSEYWAITSPEPPQRNALVKITINQDGEVLYQIENRPKEIAMHVDTSLSLYLLLDLYGSTKAIALLGVTTEVEEEPPDQAMSSSIGLSTMTDDTQALSLSDNEDGDSDLTKQQRITTECNPTLQPYPNKECCVCYDQHSNTVIYKCGHVVLCYQCAKNLKARGSSCPICRSPIVDVVKVYFS